MATVRISSDRRRIEPRAHIVLIVPAGLVVWSTGNKAPPLVERINDLAKDKRGYLQTNQQLQVYKQPDAPEQEPVVWENVWAMGDCAQIKDYFLPATAQVSISHRAPKSDLLMSPTCRLPINRESSWPRYYPAK